MEVKSFTERAAELVNATENLHIIWLAFEEGKVEKRKLSNALKSVSDQLSVYASALYYALASLEMEG